MNPNRSENARRSHRLFVFGAALLLILYFVTRLHGLLTLPLFMDEATHITRSQAVWQGHPLDLLLTGKSLGPYFAALFYPFSGAAWIGRYVVVLLGGVGIASTIALGRAIHSRAAGLLAGLLWLLNPYLFFFERMALVDATVAALAALVAFASVRMVQAGRVRDAALAGLAIALCTAAKTTGIVFAALPVAAAVLLPTRGRLLRARVRGPIITYLVAGALMLAPALYILSQAANVFGVGALSSVESASLGERLATNPGIAFGALRAYFGPAFLTLLLTGGALAVVFTIRRGLFLAALAVIPLLALCATATNLYLRYLVIGLPGILAAAAVGLVTFAGWWRGRLRLVRYVPTLMIAAWALIVALPFAWAAYADPQALPLPPADSNEYLTGWTSGYGLQGAAGWLNAQSAGQGAPVTATALLGSCNTIRLYLTPLAADGFRCPNIWEGDGLAQGRAQIVEDIAHAGDTIVIAEDNGPLPDALLPAPYTPLAQFNRPGGNYTVHVLRVTRPDSVNLAPAPRDLYNAISVFQPDRWASAFGPPGDTLTIYESEAERHYAAQKG
jgi:4-amino-4-deoxy-L-arabinose transferase-like glycosyltransferase